MRRTRLPLELVPQWAERYGIKLNGVDIAKSTSGHGWGIVANRAVTSARPPFLIVPPELVINIDRVWRCSETDRHLKEILEANGAFAKVSTTFARETNLLLLIVIGRLHGELS